MQFFRKEWRLIFVTIFLVFDLLVWYTVWCESPSDKTIVAFLNIGQGDAIYIESPTHNRIMIDGGPDRKVIGELAKFTPFYVRDIDTLIVTNPDADHFSGFLDILNLYKINRVMESGTHSSTTRYALLEETIKDKKVTRVFARRGQVLNLGGGAFLSILFPDKDVAGWNTNDGSIVAKLTYGSTSVMFTGDAPNKTEEYVLKISNKGVESTILKEGHHGSRTSASESFIAAVNPDYSIISAGLKNKYGHPHKETLDTLSKLHIPYFTTYEKGTITAVSDGLSFQIKTER